ASVCDAGVSCQRRGFQSRLEIFELAFGTAALEMVAFQRGDTGGIVTAIFKAFERIHNLIRDRTAPENADNAAHADQYLQINRKCVRISLTRIAAAEILNNYCRLK